MTDMLEQQLKALTEAAPPVVSDPNFAARVMRRITRIKRLRLAAQAAAVLIGGVVALLITPPALQAAEVVSQLAAPFVTALEPLLVSPTGIVLGLLAAAAAALHVAAD